jgi:hypothetical protein
MNLVAEDIYRSANGDRWRLMRDPDSGRVFVRHEANPASGGTVTETDVAAFLAVGGGGPEFVALRRMLDDRQALRPDDGEARRPGDGEARKPGDGEAADPRQAATD